MAVAAVQEGPAMKLVVAIVLALLVALWWTRQTTKPSLIMSLSDVLRAQRAADRPLARFCWPRECRVS